MAKLQLWVRRSIILTLVLTLGLTTLLSGFLTDRALAATQVTSRKVEIDKSNPSSTDTEYKFTFTIPDSGTIDVEGIRILWCTTALGTCTKPTAFDASAYTIDAQSFAGATVFTKQTVSENDCTEDSDNTKEACLERTDTTDEATGTAKTLTLSGILNGSTANSTVYIRMTLYNAATFASGALQFEGTMAAAWTQRLTISATVQEVLQFCIGETAVDDATTSVGADCTAVSGTTVNLGVVDSSSVTTSPDTDGNSRNGVGLLRTNASGGVVVGYKSVQQSGSNHLGTLRVSGATCNAGDINTDQCFKAFSTETAPAAGTEQFGMTVRFVNTGSGSDGTPDLTRTADYDFGSSGYAWQESGVLTSIATSTGPVDDDALILKFAAAAHILTPTGSYTALSDFIATPTF